ncbi:MAG: sigma-70 family RNA polymerase sigma factor [Acidimicrobiia bacterium]
MALTRSIAQRADGNDAELPQMPEFGGVGFNVGPDPADTFGVTLVEPRIRRRDGARLPAPSEPIRTSSTGTDAGSFADAYPELLDIAYRVAWKWTRDRERAADIAQETMIRAYAVWGKVGDQSYRAAWVARVAANVAISDWRKRDSSTRFQHLVSSEATAADHDVHTGLQIDLERALAQLPRRQREVVVLRYLEDQSEHDVAGALGCSLGTVRQHAFRGLASLRRALAGVEFDSLHLADDAPPIDSASAYGAAAAARHGAHRKTKRRAAVAAAAGVVALVLALVGSSFAGNDSSRRIRDARDPSQTTVAPTTTQGTASRTSDVTTTTVMSPVENPTPGGGGTSGVVAPGSATGTGGAASSGGSATGSNSGSNATSSQPRSGTPAGGGTSPAVERTIFGAAAPTRVDPDGKGTEVGVQFRSSVAGTVTGMRFYKPAEANATQHTGTLWDASGNVVATVTFANESASGWQRATFAAPVSIAPGVTYTVSYFAPNGRYASDQNVFDNGGTVQSGPLTATAGVYRYTTYSQADLPNEPANAVGPGGPVATYQGENYWVDPVFVAG